jgi:hypothetical protein
VVPLPDVAAATAVAVLSEIDPVGRFVVVEPGRVRERPLPDVTGAR